MSKSSVKIDAKVKRMNVGIVAVSCQSCTWMIHRLEHKIHLISFVITHKSNQDNMNLLHLKHAAGPLYLRVPHLWIQIKIIEKKWIYTKHVEIVSSTLIQYKNYSNSTYILWDTVRNLDMT